MITRILSLTLACLLFTGIHSLYGQTFKHQIENMFDEVLNLELSPGEHGGHFLPANVATSNSVINALNQVIYEKQVEISNQLKLKINLEGHTQGVYYMRIKSEEGERIEKIILN